MAEWPDAHGQIVLASTNVALNVNGTEYPMRDSSAEDCGTRCVQHIAPGAHLQGFIGYDQFLPEAFASSAPRTLSFSLPPEFCDSGEVE